MANEYVSKVVLSNGTTLIDLTGDTISPDKVLTDITFHDKSGSPMAGTCTYDSDTSDDTVAAGEMLISKTAHARGAKLTGTMPNNGAQNSSITIKAQQVTIAQGYHDGSGKVSISSTEQAKIIATNIREGITILGVQGEMSGSEDVTAQEKSATPSWSQQVISPDTGYTHLTQVTVAAIPIAYSDNSAGGQTVTIG